MREELTQKEVDAIADLWKNDISVSGAPEGWDYDYFQRQVERRIYDGASFKTAVMRVLATVPRPDDPIVKQKTDMETMAEQLKKKWNETKLAREIDYAKSNPLPPVMFDNR